MCKSLTIIIPTKIADLINILTGTKCTKRGYLISANTFFQFLNKLWQVFFWKIIVQIYVV